MVEPVVAPRRPDRDDQREEGRGPERDPRHPGVGPGQGTRQPPVAGHREHQTARSGLPGERRERRPEALLAICV
jgi:hypothetical protein